MTQYSQNAYDLNEVRLLEENKVGRLIEMIQIGATIAECDFFGGSWIRAFGAINLKGDRT